MTDIVGRPMPARRGIYIPLAMPRIPACTAVLSTSSIAAMLIDGKIPASSPIIWPLVVLAIASMGYDLGLRALQRRS